MLSELAGVGRLQAREAGGAGWRWPAVGEAVGGTPEQPSGLGRGSKMPGKNSESLELQVPKPESLEVPAADWRASRMPMTNSDGMEMAMTNSESLPKLASSLVLR